VCARRASLPPEYRGKNAKKKRPKRQCATRQEVIQSRWEQAARFRASEPMPLLALSDVRQTTCQPPSPLRALQFGIIPTCQGLFFPPCHSRMPGVERLSQETRVPPCRIGGKCAAFRAKTVEVSGHLPICSCYNKHMGEPVYDLYSWICMSELLIGMWSKRHGRAVPWTTIKRSAQASHNRSFAATQNTCLNTQE
jgi:hypothetical protein